MLRSPLLSTSVINEPTASWPSGCREVKGPQRALVVSIQCFVSFFGLAGLPTHNADNYPFFREVDIHELC